ncbi:MAG: hypothetical protein LBQ50_13565 [Planctomycetaceae bacterium]|jgi:hypothetical protein|nr:hypothetical protein [Planctomycetaceae bacterium]
MRSQNKYFERGQGVHGSVVEVALPDVGDFVQLLGLVSAFTALECGLSLFGGTTQQKALRRRLAAKPRRSNVKSKKKHTPQIWNNQKIFKIRKKGIDTCSCFV